MSFRRNEMQSRRSALESGPVFSPRTPAVKVYDAGGRSVGTFARAADALAALDSLDGAD
jgi:hypothetical protein